VKSCKRDFEDEIPNQPLVPEKAEFVSREEDYRYSPAIDWAGGKGLPVVVIV